MSIGHDIKTHLTANGYQNVTVNDVSEAKANTIAVMETGGFAGTRRHGTTATLEVSRPSFQLIIRRTNKTTAATDIAAIEGLLDGKLMTTINGTLYLSILQTTPAAFLGQVRTDAGDTNEYSLNFEAQAQVQGRT